MICIIELECFRYISFCDEQETVKKFRHEVLRTQSVVPLGGSLSPPVNDVLTRATIRRRVWNIIDNNEPSILAKVYVIGPRRDKTCLRVVPTKRDSNQYPQLHRLAKILKFRLKQV